VSVLWAVAVLAALAVTAGAIVVALMLGANRGGHGPRQLAGALLGIAAASAGLVEVSRRLALAAVRAASEGQLTTGAFEGLLASAGTSLAVLGLLGAVGLAAVGLGLGAAVGRGRGALAALPLLGPVVAVLGARLALDRAGRGLDAVLSGSPDRIGPALAERAVTLSAELDVLGGVAVGLALVGGLVTAALLAPARQRLAPHARALIPAALVGGLLLLVPATRTRLERTTAWPEGLAWSQGAGRFEPLPSDFFEPALPRAAGRFVIRVDRAGPKVAGTPLGVPAVGIGQVRQIEDAMGHFDGSLALEVDRGADGAALAALLEPLAGHGYRDLELILGRPTTIERPLFGPVPVVRRGALRVTTATTAGAAPVRVEGELETVFAEIASLRRAGRTVRLVGP
jgi:hypothetical protein